MIATILRHHLLGISRSLVWVLVVTLAGCGQPNSIIVANRSDATLTVGPGVTISGCATVRFNADDVEHARARGVEMTANGQHWEAPPGALVWDDLAIDNQGGVGTVTVVVAGSVEPHVSPA
jgi:hypothetical protein